jgi:O-antigen/teichoic acid export membrane protein
MSNSSLFGRVMRAGSLALAGNIASQLLRFGSNLLLTRLLFPEAFGLMAIANSILLAVHLISDLGLGQSIVRSQRGHESDFLNTIWVMQIGKGTLMLIVLTLASPLVAKAYSQPMLIQLIPALGLAAFIAGFASTKIALVNRKIEVGRLTLIELGSQLIGVLVMLAWASVQPTPWALVAGNLASALARTLASHLMLAGPSNSFGWNPGVFKEVCHFGGWVMMSSTVTYFAGEGRNLINAALVSTKTVGLLVLSSTLALVVWGAIQQISGQVLFPAYAEVWRNRPQNLAAVVERSRRLQLLGGCATAALLALFGDRVVAAFYDNRYKDAGIFLQIQAVGSIFAFLSASYSGVLWAIGRPGLSAILISIQVAAVSALMILGHWLAGSIGLVVGIALSGLVIYPVNASVYARLKLFQPKTDCIPIALGLALSAYVFEYGNWRGVAN